MSIRTIRTLVRRWTAGRPADVGSRLRSNSGIGLTETLISLVIFSTAMLGIVGTSARVGQTVNSSHGRQRALSVARQQLEELMAEDYASVAGGTATRDGVQLRWAVQESNVAKGVVLVYRYDLPTGVRQDTLTASILRR